jgi:hypothetical protein
MCGELLELPHKILDTFKGEKGLETCLDDRNTIAIQDEMMRNSQKSRGVEVNGTIAYAAQSPWIRNNNIRQNIIYDKPFEVDRYVNTI